MKKISMVLLIFGLAIALSFGSYGKADALTINLDYEFSGADDPVGDPPWLRATFTNVGVDTVKLYMEDLNLTGSEFVMEWYFNLDPELNPNELLFSHENGIVASVTTGVNAFKADGDGNFDILFDFPQAQGSRFGVNSTSTYLISGIVGLTASDFNFLSVDGIPGRGNYTSAAQIGGIGPDGGGSGWIGDRKAVPEPATMLLLGTALFGLAVIRRRFKE